jgi:hypothetical protein
LKKNYIISFANEKKVKKKIYKIFTFGTIPLDRNNNNGYYYQKSLTVAVARRNIIVCSVCDVMQRCTKCGVAWPPESTRRLFPSFFPMAIITQFTVYSLNCEQQASPQITKLPKNEKKKKKKIAVQLLYGRLT